MKSKILLFRPKVGVPVYHQNVCTVEITMESYSYLGHKPISPGKAYWCGMVGPFAQALDSLTSVRSLFTYFLKRKHEFGLFC